MAELAMLQQGAYQAPAPSPPQGRRSGRAALNTIIEEDENTMSPIRSPMKRRGAKRVSRDRDRLQAWLSPVNDAFPTPRGFHFMVAPNLPSSPSAASADDSISPTLSSNRTNSWNRQSVMTDVTDFDDIYDVSSEEDEPKIESMRRPGSSGVAFKATPEQTRRALPPLVIPTSKGITAANNSPPAYMKKSLTSPVPPTPPSAVAMSPAMLSFMQAQQAQEVPTISAPPSLDGSLSSEQLAVMSAPATPIIGGQDSGDTGDWSGIHLQPGALATLQALSGPGSDIEEYQTPADQVIEVPQEQMAEARPQPPRLITNLPRASIMLSPAQQRSLAGLTRLEIPSPGGFFSGLSPRTRNTWHFGASPADDMPPPTSTTAEQFYRTPWNMETAPPVPRPAQIQRPLHMASGNFSSLPVEQVVEAPESAQEDLPTAFRNEDTPVPNTAKRIPAPPSASSDDDEEAASPASPKEMIKEIVADVNPEYARRQQEVALSHLDRTEMWLMAQRAYLRGPGDFEETEDDQSNEEEPSLKAKGKQPESQLEVQTPPEVPPKDNEPEKTEVATLTRKKTVRFSEQVKPEPIPRSLPSKLVRQESAYYRAFQDYTVRSLSQDVFVHRMPRFEALQAQRVSLREAHRNQLLGKYQLSVLPQSAKKRMSANVVRGDDVLLDDPEKLKAEKEAEALSQMNMSTWHVAATRLLNGGRLIAAPVHKRLARMSTHGAASSGRRERSRILDLGGQSTGDWAWHAALQYPNAKIYTVTTKAIRQLSNSNIRGPPNHRQVAVERLARLPFPDDHFDLVSARELHSILKFTGEHGEDEWESCLRECYRVLKPGGYLEFQVLDSDIVNAGPLGLAKSVEFGFTLKTLGYDPNPTRMFLNRLSRAGFEDVRRAWMALPMGPKPSPRPGATATAARQSMLQAPVLGKTLELEAMVTGSAEHVAGVTGLAAGWSWERWLLRCEMEKAAGELRLADTVTASDAMREAGKGVDNVHAVVDEGRACKAAFRMLKGYARKPKPDMGTLTFVLDFDSMI